MSLPNRSEVSAPGLLGWHLSYWRRALYGGFQASALASAGWVVFLIVQAAISDPMRMLVSLIGGPLLHLAWEYGGAWLLGLEHEHAGEQSKSSEDPSPIAGSSTVPFKKWKRMALWTLGFAAVLALIERAVEYLDIFLASILTLFPAGVILTLSVLLFSTLWRMRMVRAQDASDRVTEALLRIGSAIPMSLLVAAIIAGATTLLSSIMVEEADDGQFVAFFWWWIPAAFGFIVAARPLKGALVAIVLLIAAGTIDTYALRWSNIASDQIQLDGRSAENRKHAIEFGPIFNSRDRPPFLTLSLAFMWRQFDPRHFLTVVGNPFVPPAFSFRAEEELAGDESHEPKSKGLEKVRQLIQRAGRLCGCSDSLSSNELREVDTTLYWQPREVAELAIAEAHHGGFCKELRLGLQSGMIRSWVVLLFFGWGIARAVRAPATEASGPKALRAAVLTTLTAVLVLILAALAIRWGVPSEPVVTVDSSFLPAAGGQVVLSWTARNARHYRWRVEPSHDVESELAKATTPEVHLKLPPNRDALAAWYTFIVEARGILNNRSRQRCVTIVVSPGTLIPARLQKLQSEGNDTASAAAVDQYGSVYLTGSTTGSFSGKVPTIEIGSLEDPAGIRNVFVAKYDPSGSLRWGLELGQDLGTSAVAVDRVENVYLGGSVRSIQPSAHLYLQEPNVRSAYVKKLDPNGAEIWTQAIAADEDEVLGGLATDAAGNVYAAGTIGPSPPGLMEWTRVETDAFLAKYDPNGKRLWLVQFGTNEDDGATGVAVDSGGTIYVTGYTKAPPYLSKFDPFVSRQGFLARFDGDGRAQWARKHGALGIFYPILPQLSIAPGEEGIVYVAGGEDRLAFLGKYDANGSVEWFRGSAFRRGSAIAAESGALYQAAGSLIAKYDGTGALQWIRQLADSLYDSRILVSGPTGLYMAGRTTSAVDLESSAASQHVFVGKLMPDAAPSHR